MNTLKIGDVVQMKTGSPNMMIVDIGFVYRGRYNAKRTKCEFFNTLTQKIDVLYPFITSLERVDLSQ